MLRAGPLHAGARALLASLVLSCVFGVGTLIGLYLHASDPVLDRDRDHDHDHDHDHELSVASDPHDHGVSESSQAIDLHDHDHDDEEEHVALTKQAYENLDLTLAEVSHRDYWKTILVPARVVEIPGQSDLSLSAPVAGIIESIDILPGQSIGREQAFMSIRITDERLTDTQSELLSTATQREIAEQEIARIEPLADSGAVSGARIRELQYDLRKLQARQATLLQDLRGRGLPESLVNSVLTNRELVRTLTVYPPSFVGTTADAKDSASTGFSIEELFVHPGMSVKKGTALCNLAYHSELYVEGTAFEQELPLLNQIVQRDWVIAAEAQAYEQVRAEETLCGSLKLLRIDNHVDEETQTIRFYAKLDNRVLHTQTEAGREFQQWQYRPGQRMHLRLPVEHWENQIVLPADAVVVEGPNAYVFMQHSHEGEEESDDIFMELEPVPVHVLHRDDSWVVVADDAQIRQADRIAMNHAYKLYLAMKMQAAGGGGHHHHHDH